jgi:hypothetical protein
VADIRDLDLPGVALVEYLHQGVVSLVGAAAHDGYG